METADSSSNRTLASVTWGRLGKVTMSLPIVGIVFCVVWSMMYDSRRSNHTHCMVWNFLPSISASTSSYQPQMFVWRICIALHAGPRYLVALSYPEYYAHMLPVHSSSYGSKMGRTTHILLARAGSVLHVVEISALLLLTMVSSVENFPIHRNAFAVFIISSLIGMAVTLVVFRKIPTHEHVKAKIKVQLARSYRWKWILFVTNGLTYVLMTYFYLRHNSYCETGVYSLFAFFEYAGVFTNMGFHWLSIIWDLRFLHMGSRFSFMKDLTPV